MASAARAALRLSWNEFRTRAADFAREWADATYEKGETQRFYNEFFEIEAPPVPCRREAGL